MVQSFLSKLTQLQSIEPDSLLIAYVTIAQGGLGLMDPSTRAIPDLVLTMSQAIRHAEQGFYHSPRRARLNGRLHLRHP